MGMMMTALVGVSLPFSHSNKTNNDQTIIDEKPVYKNVVEEALANVSNSGDDNQRQSLENTIKENEEALKEEDISSFENETLSMVNKTLDLAPSLSEEEKITITFALHDTSNEHSQYYEKIFYGNKTVKVKKGSKWSSVPRPFYFRNNEMFDVKGYSNAWDDATNNGMLDKGEEKHQMKADSILNENMTIYAIYGEAKTFKVSSNQSTATNVSFNKTSNLHYNEQITFNVSGSDVPTAKPSTNVDTSSLFTKNMNLSYSKSGSFGSANGQFYVPLSDGTITLTFGTAYPFYNDQTELTKVWGNDSKLSSSQTTSRICFDDSEKIDCRVRFSCDSGVFWDWDNQAWDNWVYFDLTNGSCSSSDTSYTYYSAWTDNDKVSGNFEAYQIGYGDNGDAYRGSYWYAAGNLTYCYTLLRWDGDNGASFHNSGKTIHEVMNGVVDKIREDVISNTQPFRSVIGCSYNYSNYTDPLDSLVGQIFVNSSRTKYYKLSRGYSSTYSNTTNQSCNPMKIASGGTNKGNWEFKEGYNDYDYDWEHFSTDDYRSEKRIYYYKGKFTYTLKEVDL